MINILNKAGTLKAINGWNRASSRIDSWVLLSKQVFVSQFVTAIIAFVRLASGTKLCVRDNCMISKDTKRTYKHGHIFDSIERDWEGRKPNQNYSFELFFKVNTNNSQIRHPRCGSRAWYTATAPLLLTCNVNPNFLANFFGIFNWHYCKFWLKCY